MPDTTELLQAAHDRTLAMTEAALSRPRVKVEAPTIEQIEAAAAHLETLLRNAGRLWDATQQPAHMFADELPCPVRAVDAAHCELLCWMQEWLAPVRSAIDEQPDPDEQTDAQMSAWHNGRVL
jgi:hypothetical protein